MCDFNLMPEKEGLMYQQLWHDKNYVETLLNCKISERGNKNRPTSFYFDGEEETLDLLKTIFEIENEEMFDMKFKMVTGGDGDEGRKIRTLHSSSLCALLFFYNVTKDHSLTLDLEGRKIKFTRSAFEFKSPVIRNPSNMDVVLYGEEEKTGKTVVFLLESKLSEHYMCSDNILKGVSVSYYEKKNYSKPFYERDFLKILNLSSNPENLRDKSAKEFDLILNSEDQEQNYYIGGIKQMISHYVGMRKLEQNKFYGGKKKGCHICIEEAIADGADIILGEILFGDDVEVMKQATSKYKEKYKLLAEKMNFELKNDAKSRLSVLKEDLSYSKLFKNKAYKVEEKIWKYYFERGTGYGEKV